MKRDKEPSIPKLHLWGMETGKFVHAEKLSIRIEEDMVQLQPHRIEHFILIWLLKGSGKTYFDFVPYELSPNTLFLKTPAHIHWIEAPRNQEFEVYIVAFGDKALSIMGLDSELKVLLKNISTVTAIQPDANYQQVLKTLMDQIIIEAGSEAETFSEKIVASSLKTILLYILRLRVDQASIFKPKNQTYFKLFSEFIDQLEENYKSLHQVRDYVDLLYTSDRRLNRACQNVARESAGKVIQKRIDLEAKRLLIDSSFTLKEIAYQIGFKDPAHFTKFFRNLNGYPPSGFRENILISDENL